MQCCPKSITRVLRHYWRGFFHVQCCLKPLGQHCTRFLPVQCCPKGIKRTLNKIFPVQYCLEPLGQHGTRFFQLLSAKCCPKKNKTTLKNIFLCLQPQGQHYIARVFPVEYCPKSIKKTQHRIFSAMLSAASFPIWPTKCKHRFTTTAIFSWIIPYLPISYY